MGETKSEERSRQAFALAISQITEQTHDGSRSPFTTFGHASRQGNWPISPLRIFSWTTRGKKPRCLVYSRNIIAMSHLGSVGRDSGRHIVCKISRIIGWSSGRPTKSASTGTTRLDASGYTTERPGNSWLGAGFGSMHYERAPHFKRLKLGMRRRQSGGGATSSLDLLRRRSHTVRIISMKRTEGN